MIYLFIFLCSTKTSLRYKTSAVFSRNQVVNSIFFFFFFLLLILYQMPGLINETIVEEMRFLRWQLLSRSVDLEPCMEPTDLVDFEQTHMLR